MSVERPSSPAGTGDNNLDASGFTRGGVVLVGGGGTDHLIGGTSRDLLIGGLGLDTLDGEAGRRPVDWRHHLLGLTAT
ncbi:MAG: hypothetical protein U0736_10320 [Gemmataceae bacterium]